MNAMIYIARLTILSLLALSAFSASAQQTWRGLTIEPEYRCSAYDKKAQYPYPQSVEDLIVMQMGGRIYGPYTGRYFDTDTQTDIEHIVAASEGHDSGLCAASDDKRKQFATDLLNLTLAAPKINRCGAEGKCGLDPAEWMPTENQCWFASRVVEIKTKYGLSVDQSEAQALEAVLAGCTSFEMIFFAENNQYSTEMTTTDSRNILSIYDDNGNGRITCSEARAHGITPVTQAHPAYSYMNDSDGDGVVCE